MSFTKAFYLVLCSLAAGALLLWGGCYGLSKVILSSKTCEQFNIDNTELRASINIPKIRDVVCNYDAAKDVKTNLFYLDLKSGKALSEYIGYNNLVNAANAELPLFQTMQQWNAEITRLPRYALYYKYGGYHDYKRTIILDSLTQRLWIEIRKVE